MLNNQMYVAKVHAAKEGRQQASRRNMNVLKRGEIYNFIDEL